MILLPSFIIVTKLLVDFCGLTRVRFFLIRRQLIGIGRVSFFVTRCRCFALLVFHVVLVQVIFIRQITTSCNNAFLLIAELGLLHLADGVDVGELALHVPVFVEEIIITSKLLRHFANQVQILLGLKSGYEDIAVPMVHHFYVDEALACHDGLHEAEIEAPDHDNTKYNRQRRHDNPILNIVHIEDLLLAAAARRRLTRAVH